MNTIDLARLVGTVSILVLFAIKFYIVIDTDRFHTSGRVAMLWTIMYVFFLFILRLLALIKIGDPNSLVIISSYSTLIPLFAVLIHLFLYKSQSHQDTDTDQII